MNEYFLSLKNKALNLNFYCLNNMTFTYPYIHRTVKNNSIFKAIHVIQCKESLSKYLSSKISFS